MEPPKFASVEAVVAPSAARRARLCASATLARWASSDAHQASAAASVSALLRKFAEDLLVGATVVDMPATSTSSTGSIREQRLATGLTQTELAARAGCSVAYVRQLEAGCLPRHSRVLPDVMAALDDERAAVQGDALKTADRAPTNAA